MKNKNVRGAAAKARQGVVWIGVYRQAKAGQARLGIVGCGAAWFGRARQAKQFLVLQVTVQLEVLLQNEPFRTGEL